MLLDYTICCALFSLGGGTLSFPLPIQVVTYMGYKSIIPINFEGKGPLYVTYLDEDARELT